MRGGSDEAVAVGVIIVRNETPLFSDVLAKALSADPAVRLLTAPVAPRTAPGICRRYRPDVVVVEATQARTAELRSIVETIRSAPNGAAIVIVVDEVIGDEFLVAGLEAGAAGVVDASAAIGDVVDAVRRAAEGKRIVDSTRLAGALEATARTRERERRRVQLLGLLSDREREVLGCLSHGLSNAEIAQDLSISPRTVEKHVHNILAKLEVGSRLAAVTLTTEMGDVAHPEMRGTA
jgi:RNA polymerase sigma factor (sigma-70 family)